MELKFPLIEKTSNDNEQRSNRTFMELKFCNIYSNNTFSTF